MKKRSMMNADDGWGGGRKKLADEADLDITPMIDVTFLLLIFFMVTSTMKGNPDAELPTAKHGIGLDTQGVTKITIKAPDSEGIDPEVELENSKINIEKHVVTSMDEITAQVTLAVNDGYPNVVIKSDRNVTHGFVQEVARAVTAVENVKFYIGVQDKKQKR